MFRKSQAQALTIAQADAQHNAHLSFGGAFVGFMISTGLMISVMLLLSAV